MCQEVFVDKEPEHVRKRKEHIARRHEQGFTYRELAKEFNESKSSLHRKMTEDKDD